MNINYRKLTHTEINNSKKISEFFVEVEGQIKEQDLKNVINNLINEYIKRGYTEEEISLMTFYRYPTKVKK
jgi:DNA-binding transcriptional regulator YhcF (GntR family)